MLYLYEATLPEDNNDSEVKGAYEISLRKKDGYVASFDFDNPENASQAVDSWLISQGITSKYIVNVVK
ncbi:hypothetical protein ORL49_15880 [Klebsiella michiganensis]|uniref:hypothetical protein n=1 Tax=Klebsiella michiganensis TaxID=1134687 RepID=UPI0015BA4F9B|nr:hypothetical protein [Klebsiella michiganensis]MCW9516160.1 hypothetical protein [Klebsiella michiganensis]NWN29300.1 hypothetical protein [Klebsiella michiganensis]